MGVPKFFRYISERYPCLSQLVSECEIPEFDNLYLDMNGIIHNCSHPNDYDPHFRITEEKIFKDIFHYIEVLFRIIKPQKLFFMAVDGVAPRAKMNQQRGRRFRSAKEAEEQEKAALKKGVTLPDEQRFDSNCITPGTSFMAKLQAQLKYFVTSKISTDKSWQNVKIILSGHECPGEGEHKIMDYIRYLRAQEDYEPNTRHCLYGLDADLIMLGLCTHDPHFSLLREEVKFGRKQQSKKTISPEDTKFFLLHLSLLREYLEMEFSLLKETLPFAFNLENVIDDWVLMGFLVGNDFIPHLPGFHISSGALPVLFKAYCDVLPTLDGYLNEGGTLNLPRFEAYMRKLGSFDIKQFRDVYDDLKYLKSKRARTGTDNLTEDKIQFTRKLEPYFEKAEAENDCDLEETIEDNTDQFEQAVQDMMELDDDDGSDYFDEDDKEQDRLAFFQEFCLHKQNYYQDKLEFKKITPEELRNQAEGYVKAIQWNLHYYYNGICSWSWFYPHHYAPYISDIQNFKDMKIEFDMGKPFLPFEQLLAVLPALSKKLLPKPFQELMTDEASPIFDYYPCDFDTDLNGKKNDWEAVVLIPFIDEQRLLQAMQMCYDLLTDEEKERNTHGPMHMYTYTEENQGRYEAPAYFSPVEHNHALDTPVYREDIMVSREKLRKGLMQGVKLDVYFPGFPTFKNIPYTSVLSHQGVRVFQNSSQGLNMIVKVLPPEEEKSFPDVVQEFMNKNVFVSWPYLLEAKVIEIISSKHNCALQAGMCSVQDNDENDTKQFSSAVSSVKQDLLKSKGIDVGVTKFLLRVRLMDGKKYVFTANNKIRLDKKWSNKIYSYPLQTIVKDVAPRSNVLTDVTIDEIFPVGCNCFIINNRVDFYGCLGTVSERSDDNALVRIKINSPPEPEQEHFRLERSKISYYSTNEAAQRASVSNYMLARITGTILVLDTDDVLQADKCSKVNIGLNLKFSRRNQLLPGYTKRTEQNQWLYSDKTIALVREYIEAFPDVTRYLMDNDENKDLIFKNDLFPLGQSHMLHVISNWLDSKAELKAERRSCDAVLLEGDVIAELEAKIEQFMRKNKRGVFLSLKIKPHHLYSPSSQIEKQTPDSSEFRLLDRVVNVRDNFVIPLGARGTIIGIEKPSSETGLTYCDILLDQPIQSAMQYNTKKKRVYKLPDRCMLSISHAKRIRQKDESRKVSQKQMMPPLCNLMQIPTRPPMVNQNMQHYSPKNLDNRGQVIQNSTSRIVYSTQAQQSGLAASFPDYPFGSPNTIQVAKQRPMRSNIDLMNQSKVGSSAASSTALCNPSQTGSTLKHVAPESNQDDKMNETTLMLKKMLGISQSSDEAAKQAKNIVANGEEVSMDPSELLDLYTRLRLAAAKTNFERFEWGMWKRCHRVVVDKLFELDPAYTVYVLEQTRDKYEQKVVRRMARQAPSKRARHNDGRQMWSLRQLEESLRSMPTNERNPPNRKNDRGYVIELQELFQKAGKGNPKYEYRHVDGNFRATLYLPGIETGISSDLAPTKKAAGEKAAFRVLQFLNLVQNYGDRVPPLPSNEIALSDLNMQFLRLQQKLQESQQPPAHLQRPPAALMDNRTSGVYSMLPPEADGMQMRLQMQQQNLQMMLNSQPPLQQPPPQQQMQAAANLQQQQLLRNSQFSQSMSPFQPPRQMTLATNYIYQQNVAPTKGQLPQQLYYQNVQNFYYNQPAFRANFQTPSQMQPQQQWFAPVMPQPNVMNMPPNVHSRQYYPEAMAQPIPQSMEKSGLQNMNFFASSSQATFTPSTSAFSEPTKNNLDSRRPSQTESNVCSGRVSKTPKKNRLAANFATKAAT